MEELIEERTHKLREAQQGLIMVEKHVGIGRLAAGVAHEIKNQLAPVLTEAQRLIGQIENGKELSPEYIMERAQTIEEASRTANKITMALLDYARESRPEFSSYNLRESREEPYVVISIRDTGIGIPKEDQGKIFDPFFTTKSPRGVGLGLSVSYGIVERHGGRIDFDSQIGEGTTFRVYLPPRNETNMSHRDTKDNGI